jgi:hypothetical protein
VTSSPQGDSPSVVARIAMISRQALYRTPRPRRAPQRRPLTDPVELVIVEEATANQTDGYRMVTALVRRRLGRPVNRKRVLRVMRERNLIQRRRPLERRKRPGFFRVERPRRLWQLDMSSGWVAEHGWTYLMAIIDTHPVALSDRQHLALDLTVEQRVRRLLGAKALEAASFGDPLGFDDVRRWRLRGADRTDLAAVDQIGETPVRGRWATRRDHLSAVVEVSHWGGDVRVHPPRGAGDADEHRF